MCCCDTHVWSMFGLKWKQLIYPLMAWKMWLVITFGLKVETQQVHLCSCRLWSEKLNVKTAPHGFPEIKLMSSNWLFCLTSSPNLINISSKMRRNTLIFWPGVYILPDWKFDSKLFALSQNSGFLYIFSMHLLCLDDKHPHLSHPVCNDGFLLMMWSLMASP